MNTIIHDLDQLATRVSLQQIGEDDPWGGADVYILPSPPTRDHGGWSDPYYVVTPFARELSWLFCEARDIAMIHEDYGMFKELFFGRMAEAANEITDSEGLVLKLLGALREAYFILTTALTGEPFPDDVTVTTDDIKAFYAGRGIALPASPTAS
jgi:hypothetical protein